MRTELVCGIGSLILAGLALAIQGWYLYQPTYD